MNSDHCRLDYSAVPNRFVCEHCGLHQPLSLPMPITEVVALSDAFVQWHRHCVKRTPNLGKIRS